MPAKAASLLAKGAIKLFHGAKKDFDSFDSDFAAETAFGKGFSFTPEQGVAESYANITPAKLRKLYGKDHIDSAIERKKGGTPILYEVEANVKDSEVLVVRKNFEDQNKKIQEKFKKLIKEEGLNIEDIDLTKPKFWRQILKLTNKDADKLFSKYGIKASLKDAQDSKLKQVGGKIEYTVYDPTVLKIKDKKFLERNKKNTGGEITMHCKGDGKKKRMKKAVGSVAQKAAEGADSLLSEARKDVVAARGPEETTPKEFEEMAEAVSKVKGSAETEAPEVKAETMKDTTKLINSLDFAQGGNKKMDKQFVMESLQQVADTPIIESKESVAEFIADLHRTQMDEESKPLLSTKDFEKLTEFASEETEGRMEKNEGGVLKKDMTDVEKFIYFTKEYERELDAAKTDKSRDTINRRYEEIKDSFDMNTISEAYEKMDADREGKAFGGLLSKISGAAGAMIEAASEDAGKIKGEGQMQEASISNLEGPDPIEPSNNAAQAMAQGNVSIGYAEGGNVEDKMKVKYAEGGSMLDMPVDTYDNIRPEEKAAVEASQKPDDVMEDEYAEYVMDEALTTEDQEYLLNALEGDERLGTIFDKVMDIAGEFAGEGAVNGPGTGTSDSIPARLSDGEFVFTKKAVDQIGVDKLQEMMDDAERAYDGGLMKKYGGGSIMSGLMDVQDPDMGVHNQMLGSNAMPSVQKR